MSPIVAMANACLEWMSKTERGMQLRELLHDISPKWLKLTLSTGKINHGVALVDHRVATEREQLVVTREKSQFSSK